MIDVKLPHFRRVGVDHYTEHDFEMERIGREQNTAIYKSRLQMLEAHGFVPFQGPYYFGGVEWHGGHHPPGTEKQVPTKVAFAMLLEEHPEVELEPWKPHPHGWTPPTAEMGFTSKLVSIEPMKTPVGLLFLTTKFEYGTKEEIEKRHARKARLDKMFESIDGIRSYGVNRCYPSGYHKPYDYVDVKLEHEGARSEIPEQWEGLPVEIGVRPEAEERAEKEMRDKAERERYEEESLWLRKASSL